MHLCVVVQCEMSATEVRFILCNDSNRIEYDAIYD